MMDILKFIDARLGEPSTWASIATMLAVAHVSVPAGVWDQVTLWGIVVAGTVGVFLKEAGTKPTTQIASDALSAFVAAVKAMPDTKPPA